MALAISLLLSVPAAAADDADEAYRAGDYATALGITMEQAELGLDFAQFNLGLMYAKGHGLPQDYARAVNWYQKAATQGFASAQLNLGVMYYKGQGVLPDHVQAYMWFYLAASRFTVTEKENRGRAAHNRDLVASKMTSEQIVEAQRMARDWKSSR